MAVQLADWSGLGFSGRLAAQAYLPRDGALPVRVEEFVEGLSEQGLDSAVLHDAEQAQLAVDSRGKVAGDGDGAGAAVPGMAGRGAVSPSGRESTSVKGLSVSGISVSHVVAQPRSEGADLASRLAAWVRLRHGKAQGQAVRDLGPVVAHGGLGEIRRPAAWRDVVQHDREGKGGERAEAGGGVQGCDVEQSGAERRAAARAASRRAAGTAPTNGERPRLSPHRAALAWGSRSIRAAEPPAPSKSAATWTARMVLPVPPFWANSAMVYIASATVPSLSRMRPPG